jgi:hypothetical protein
MLYVATLQACPLVSKTCENVCFLYITSSTYSALRNTRKSSSKMCKDRRGKKRRALYARVTASSSSSLARKRKDKGKVERKKRKERSIQMSAMRRLLAAPRRSTLPVSRFECNEVILLTRRA